MIQTCDFCEAEYINGSPSCDCENLPEYIKIIIFDLLQEKRAEYNEWRRMFAGMALQGILSNEILFKRLTETLPMEITEWAVEYADSLAEVLAREKTNDTM